MAIKKISELPEASAVDAVDQVVLNQGGVTKRAPVSLLPGTGGGSGSSTSAPSASQLAAASTLDGAELLVIQRLSATVKLTATTISALAADNSINDSANGFLAAGFAVGMQVRIQGFTGNAVNNLYSATVTAASAGKLVFGGTDGDAIVDDAAGEAVTVTAWEKVRATAAQVAALATGGGSGGGGLVGLCGLAGPAGWSMSASGTQITPTSTTFAMLVTLTGPMYVDSLVLRCTATGAGTVTWGLHSVSAPASPSASSVVCSGSGVLSVAGIRELPAASGPVLVPAGHYVLVVAFPATGVPSVSRLDSPGSFAAPGAGQKYKNAVAAAAAVDFSAGWTADSAVLWTYLRGRLSASVAW
jgi:hypothetical protein